MQAKIMLKELGLDKTQSLRGSTILTVHLREMVAAQARPPEVCHKQILEWLKELLRVMATNLCGGDLVVLKKVRGLRQRGARDISGAVSKNCISTVDDTTCKPQPLLVLCGDWAAGGSTFSSCVSSGIAAAREVKRFTCTMRQQEAKAPTKSAAIITCKANQGNGIPRKMPWQTSLATVGFVAITVAAVIIASSSDRRRQQNKSQRALGSILYKMTVES